MRRKKSLGSTILGLLVVALVWFLKEKGIVDDSGGRSGSSGPSPAESSDWSYLKECRLITGRNGDGDSFHVKHEQGETEFRLYYCLLYTSPSPRDQRGSRMPSSA